MRKTTKALMAVILVAIMSLGIGYAAIEDITLNISGTVKAIPLIAGEVPQSVFYYVGYGNGKYWNPGDKAQNLVVHYDGIYNKLSGSSISHASQSTWSDLSGNGNTGSIVKGSLVNSANIKIDDVSATNDTVDWYFESGPTVTQRSTGSYSWGNNYLNVICNSPTGLPVGGAEYTMEITFYYTGTSEASSGLIGTGIYNSVSSIDNIGSRLTRAYNKAKIWHIINWYFFNQYEFYPYKQYPSSSDRGLLSSANETPTSNPDNSGKANAIRINDNGNGIYQYYWDNDLDTGNKLTPGIHTINTKYKNSTTYIYIDGQYITSKTSTPNTSYTLDYNHNRPTASDTQSDGTKKEKYSVQPLTVGATHLKVATSLPDLGAKWCCALGLWNRNHCYANINYTLDYQEFFDGNIYSVRIYDRALEENEIKQNRMVDEGRFNINK